MVASNLHLLTNSSMNQETMQALEWFGITTEFYRKLCKGQTKLENLLYRKRVLTEGYSSEAMSDELWIMCKRDPLFYINTFVYTYDPRLTPRSTVIPFHTFTYQNNAVLEIILAILEGNDLFIEKSRDAGASWLILTVYKWFWTFYDMQSFRLVSRNEDLVDKHQDPDSLFWKILFIIEHEPDFIMSNNNFHKTHLHLYNKVNSSVIDGSSTTGDVTRGGRCASMMLDEFGAVSEGYEVLEATRDVTKCRIFNSTPNGAANAFYDIGYKTDIARLRFHWSEDPRKNQGLYTTGADGKVRTLDPGTAGYFKILKKKYFYPDDWPFILDGKLRSPWYDNECARTAHPTEIAKELDIDYLGSDYQFFYPDELNRIEKEHIRQPYFQGEFDFDRISLDFKGLIPEPAGRLSLWINPDVYGAIPADLDAVVGVDVAAGTGASNSVISIINRKTKTDIGDWRCPYVSPEKLAKVAVAICKYFNDARMIWDAGGPGRIFGNKVMELGYDNFYYRTDEKKITHKQSDIPGYPFNPANKVDTFGELRSAMGSDEYIPRSAIFIQECREYVYSISTDSIEHAKSKNFIDPSGARENHGDTIVAKSLAWKLIKVSFVAAEEAEVIVPDNCFAARRKIYDERLAVEAVW